MVFSLLRRKQRDTGSPELREVSFEDPILPDGLDMEAILEGMQITMQNGQIKTAIERVSEAMRPFVVNKLLGGVPPEVLDSSTSVIKKEVSRLPSTRTIEEADGDWARAAVISEAQLAELVMRQYTDAAASSANGH